VKKGIKNLANMSITVAELFAIAETSALAGHDDEYMNRAYLIIIAAMNDGETMDQKLVKDKLKKQLKLQDRARARRGSSPVALRASISSRGARAKDVIAVPSIALTRNLANGALLQIMCHTLKAAPMLLAVPVQTLMTATSSSAERFTSPKREE
jgi:hypothetical protein